MPKHGGADLFEMLLDRLFDGVLILDTDEVITVWNKAAERMTGHRAADLIGKKYRDSPVQHLADDGREAPAAHPLALATLKDGAPREGKAYFRHVDGFRLPVVVRTNPIFSTQGEISGVAEIFSDNKSMIAALQNAPGPSATILLDPLTGIGNRPHIEVKIKMAHEAFLAGGLSFGVLFMDIDHFKSFNDTYGHLTGDKILRFVANSIRNNLRTSDSCGRWGGEEFIAVLMDIDADGLRRVAEKLRQVVAQTQVMEDDRGLSVTISIGATLVHADDTLPTLIQRVDQLMYQSKLNGRNQVTTRA